MAVIPHLVIAPLMAAFLIPIFGKKVKWWGWLISVLASFMLVILSGRAAFLTVSSKTLVYKMGNWMPPLGVPLVVDAFSAIILVTVNMIVFCVSLYCIDYIRKYTDTWKFYSLFMMMVAGINGVLVSGDIFNLYVFLEIAAISGYFLVAFGIEPDELEAAFKYAVMGTVASAFILLGIAFLYSYTSTLNMADMAQVLALKGPSHILLFVSVLFIMGFGLKAALVPFHSWLPYAHSSAPSPISAMLSGVSIKVLGIYALARILFNVLGIAQIASPIIISLAIASMLLGSVLAFGQTDIKRLFAYSSISQIGYVVLGIGIGTPLSILGGLFHLVNHSLSKALLFLNSGSIEQLTGSRNLDKIRNVAAHSPVTGYANLAGALSICGIPPLGGFWSKLIIILACVQAGHPVLAFIAVLVSAMTLAYYFKALTPAIFGKDKTSDLPALKKISWQMAMSMVLLAIFSIASFAILLPNAGNVLLKDAASVLGNGKNYAEAIIGALK